jgi:hypothetical protein
MGSGRAQMGGDQMGNHHRPRCPAKQQLPTTGCTTATSEKLIARMINAMIILAARVLLTAGLKELVDYLLNR